MGKRSFSNACIYNGHGWNIAETGNCCMITRDGWSGMAMEVNALCSTRTDCLPFYASEKSSYVCSSPSSPPLIKLQQWKTQHLAMRVVRLRVRTVNKTVYANKLENGSFGGNLENGFGRKKLAVFVSGGGSNFKSLHQATLQGSVSGYVAVVVTDKPGCGGSEYAKEKDIPVIFFPKSLSLPGGLSAVDLVTTLGEFGIDFILLAGYLKLIPVELVRAYPRSILNIHPSLLPSFGGKGYYGSKVHKAVIASGVRYSGPTIHFVDEHYDSGRILAQRVVPVLAKDTPEELAARVLCEEHRLYVEVAAALCDDRIIWREDGVPLIRSKTNPNEYS